jgi:hypothetical protein
MILCSSVALGGDCIDYADYVRTVGWIDLFGEGESVTVTGAQAEIAYVALGHQGIAAVDVSSNEPALFDTLRTPGYARAIALRGDIAWVAAGPAGIVQVDISDPKHLAFVGSMPTPGEAWDIALNGAIAAIATWDAGFQLLDIADPKEPHWLGGSDLPGFGVAIAAAGNHVYVLDFVALRVIECSDPTSPSIVGVLSMPGKATDITVLEDRAYVAAGESGACVVDVSNPRLPSLLTTVELPDDLASYIAVSPTHLFATGESLHLIELTNPPTWIGRVNTGAGNLGATALDSNRAFLIGQSRLDLVDIQPPVFAPVLGEYSEELFFVNTVSILDHDHACIAGSDSRGYTLRVIDVTKPTLPTSRGRVELENFVMDLLAADAHVYAAVDVNFGASRLQVFDCHNPDSPHQVGEMDLEGGFSGFALEGDYLYVAASRSKSPFKVIDVTQPNAPKVISELMTNRIHEVTLHESYAYVADEEELAIIIIDIADPAAPVVAESYDLPGRLRAGFLAIEGTTAYVVAAEEFSLEPSLILLDLTNPLVPVEIGALDLPVRGGIGDLAVAGGMAYVDSQAGVLVIDARLPASMAIVGSGYSDVDVRRIAVNERGIHVAGGDRYGILPLQCQEPQAVELAAFDAVAEPGAIRITWRTSREEDHLGFQVERAMAEVGPFLRIHRHLIEPPGPYAHRDPSVLPGATYYYRLAALDRFGGIEHFGPLAATAIAGDATVPPAAALATTLARSQPNPFTPATTHTQIRFTLAHPGPATLRLYDPAGRLIQTLIDGPLSAGEHLAKWDGRNTRGEPAAAGTYFYKLTAGDFTATRALVRLR